MDVYVGTYTDGTSKGIYRYQLQGSGELAPKGLVCITNNPSYVVIHPTLPVLYAVNEEEDGDVSCFIQDGEGTFRSADRQSTGGAGPCHLAVDPSGKYLVIANYGGGSVCAIPLQTSGMLGDPTDFIQHSGPGIPHAHHVVFREQNRVYVCDLGLDSILGYHLDLGSGNLSADQSLSLKLAPGAGPRHLTFHPSGRFAYVINELDSTITAMNHNALSGSLQALQTISTLPAEYQGSNAPSDIHVHPSGQFLYGANRGHNSIAIFYIEQSSGKLALLGHEPTRGEWPRSFALDPSGRYLVVANQHSDSIATYYIKVNTGHLEFTGHMGNVGSPVCVVFA